MPFAITLRLDPDSATSIERLWLTLAAKGIDTDRRDLGYPAHITLAIYPDDVSVDSLLEAFTRITLVRRRLSVTLGGIGIFPGASSILWVAPAVTADLLAFHASVAEALPDAPPHPHYQPSAWMPHITLTSALADPGPALAALLPLWRPLTVRLVQAELVRFRPVEVLRSQTLLS